MRVFRDIWFDIVGAGERTMTRLVLPRAYRLAMIPSIAIGVFLLYLDVLAILGRPVVDSTTVRYLDEGYVAGMVAVFVAGLHSAKKA